jgi:hypothetical protein
LISGLGRSHLLIGSLRTHLIAKSNLSERPTIVVMDQTTKPDHARVVSKAVATIVVGLLLLVGLDALRHYIRSKQSSRKVATLSYLGEWLVGEYRECESENLRHMETPEIACSAFPLDNQHVVNIEFKGGPTYDSTIADGAVFTWLCRRTDGNVGFSCVKQPMRAERQPKPVASLPERIPIKRGLSEDDVQYYRKRNECEQRFYDKKMYQANGLSIGAACKQNPDLKP